MKFSRLASLLLIASALPAAAFAASRDGAKFAHRGEGSITTDGVRAPITDDSTITQGSTIATSPTGPGLEITLPGGATLKLSPGTRIIVKQAVSPTTGVYAVEIVLLRGNVSGDTTEASAASSLTIRTTAGTINAAGSQFSATFFPTDYRTGSLSVATIGGNPVTVQPTDSTSGVPLSVPAGQQTSVGTGVTGAPVLTTISPSVTAAYNAEVQASSSGSTTKTGTNSTDSSTGTTAGSGNTQTMPDFGLVVTSPSGEGAGGTQ